MVRLTDHYVVTSNREMRQIEEKNYQASLVAKGVPEEHIRKYGFAFVEKRY